MQALASGAGRREADARPSKSSFGEAVDPPDGNLPPQMKHSKKTTTTSLVRIQSPPSSTYSFYSFDRSFHPRDKNNTQIRSRKHQNLEFQVERIQIWNLFWSNQRFLFLFFGFSHYGFLIFPSVWYTKIMKGGEGVFFIFFSGNPYAAVLLFVFF